MTILSHGAGSCEDFIDRPHNVILLVYKGQKLYEANRSRASLVAQRVVSPCNAGDLGLIPESGRSPGEGNGNSLQYSCLENPRDGGAW